jgi:hypothetical protein
MSVTTTTVPSTSSLAFPPSAESQYLDHARWRTYVRQPYLQGESSRFKLFTRFAPAVGTWRIDVVHGLYGREISALVELDPHTLVDSELDAAGLLSPERRPDAKRYEYWIREGNRPPPIEVLETDNGLLKVTDGHRRLVASRAAGTNLLCWVSPSVGVPSGAVDCNGQPIKAGLTFEMWLERGLNALDGSQFCARYLIDLSRAMSP